MNEEDKTLAVEQLSSFKLIKNSKGYGWEIKVYNKDPAMTIAQVETLNNRAITLFVN